MFGQNDDQTQTMQTNTSAPQDVPADGTLGSPMSDSSSLPMTAPDGAVATPMADDDMPSYEPTGSGDRG